MNDFKNKNIKCLIKLTKNCKLLIFLKTSVVQTLIFNSLINCNKFPISQENSTHNTTASSTTMFGPLMLNSVILL